MMLKMNRLLLATALTTTLYATSVLGSKPRNGAKRQRQLQPNGDNDEPLQSILDIATGDKDFSTLVEALEAANLVAALGGDGPLTVFAPTNAAFDDADIDFLLGPEWTKHLEAVLLYHVVSGAVNSSDLTVGQAIPTLLEGETPLNVTSLDPLEDDFSINDVEVIAADLAATNGIVHVLDEVLLPEFASFDIVELAASDRATFSTLVDLLILANLTDILSDGVYTVFAPTNDAFDKLPPADLDSLTDPSNVDILTDILLYHVSPGMAYADGVQVGDEAVTAQGDTVRVSSAGDDGLVINDVATVVSADILASNGVIHAIDTVLIPSNIEEVPDDDEEEEVVPAENATDATVDEVAQVVDDEEEEVVGDDAVVTEAPTAATDDAANAPIGALNLATWTFLGEDYSTLYSLLNETGLLTTLVGDGPLTLLAPTNEAFAAVPGVEKYSDPEWYAHLYDVLLYHVLPGTVLSTDLEEGGIAFTALGENLTITSIDPVTINVQSTVVDPDNVLTNGVAHGIDAVLLPPSASFNIVDIIGDSPFFEELLALVAAAGLEDVLTGPGPYTIFAPTNNAIGRLDEATLATLTSEEGLPELQRILQYHIVPGIILSDDVASGEMFSTLQGDMLTLTQDGETFFINDAEIVDGDILASNGVIHVVNRVLLPPPVDAEVVPEETGALADNATQPVDPTETTEKPTEEPTDDPTDEPTDEPTEDPTSIETEAPEAIGNATDDMVGLEDESETPEVPVEDTEETVEEPATDLEEPTEVTEAVTDAPASPTSATENGAVSGAPVSRVLSALAMASILPFLLFA